MLVSDNGSVFASSEFQEFMSQNLICHVLTSPYHPASNGPAERAVQLFKAVMKKMTSGPIETRIAKFLLYQHLTPHPSTGNSPAELLPGRRPRSLLDVVRPDLSRTVRQHQERQKQQHDSHAMARKFSEGDLVFVHNFSSQHLSLTLIPGRVLTTQGPVSYSVLLSNHGVVR